MSEEFLLPKDAPRDEAISRLIRHLHTLDPRKRWRVSCKEEKRLRTGQQNRFLWGLVYPSIIEQGGEALAGWNKDDIHEYFLGEWSGWEVLEGFGRKRMRPFRRSSNLSITEFMHYIDFIQQRAAGMGIVIPDPSEFAAEAA